MKREGHIWSKPQSLKLAKIPLIDLFHLFHKLKLTYSKFSEKNRYSPAKFSNIYECYFSAAHQLTTVKPAAFPFDLPLNNYNKNMKKCF